MALHGHDDDGEWDDLLAEVAHELANPLTIARGFASALLEEDLEDDARQAARAVERNIDIALQLLATYRDATRPGEETITLDLSLVPLAELVDDTLADLSSITDPRPVDVEHADRDLHLLADPARLRQALFNLIANAVRHTPPDAAIHLRTWTEDRALTIEIADEGEGVAPDVADRIFEPGVKGDQTADGLGIGLYVARRIARAHGGDLDLVPTADGGARFHLRLPVGD